MLVLQSGFSEGELAKFGNEDDLTLVYEVPPNDYGYDSDSDLEDEDDDNPTKESSTEDRSEASIVNATHERVKAAPDVTSSTEVRVTS